MTVARCSHPRPVSRQVMSPHSTVVGTGGSASSAFGSGSPPSSRLRFTTQLFTVFEFSPSSRQHSVMGFPDEMT